MKVTVIMPVYNRVEFLPLSLGSLLSQAGDCDLDVLVVDDGSTDGTPQFLAKMAQKDARVRVIRRENGGVTKARNTGLKNLLPETHLVSFLDSDDICPPDRFRADLPFFARDPELQVTYGRMLVTDKLCADTGTIPEGAETAEVAAPHLTPALIRRDSIERVGLFDEEMVQSEDVDYLFRLFEMGVRFLQTETICLYYLRHAGNMTRSQEIVRKYFALAVLKSMRRRKADPSIVSDRPRFDVEAMRNFKGY